MTIEELAKLTPEEKRVKIAELLRWTDIEWYHPRKEDPFDESPEPIPFLRGHPPGGLLWNIIPDYLNDLNAMREAEEVAMKDTQGYSSNPFDHEPWRYVMQLGQVVGVHMKEEHVLSGLKKPDGTDL